MRSVLTLCFTEPIFLTRTPFSEVQGLIYSILPERFHKNSYSFKNKGYKMFTFAILNDLHLDKKKNRFIPTLNDITILFSTPLEEIDKNFLPTDKVNLNGQRAYETRIKTYKPQTPKAKSVIVKTLSPIVIGDYNKGKTEFYNPSQLEFTEGVKQNAFDKFQAFYNDCKTYDFTITPIFTQKKIAVLNFGYKYVVEGTTGVFKLESNSEDFLYFTIEAGLGQKNAQGFGLVDVVEVIR